MALVTNNTYPTAKTQETQQTQKRYIVLSNGSLVAVPDGADAEYVRLIEERKLERKAVAPRKRSASRSGSSRNSKRTNYAAQVLERSAAMAELTVRVNGPKPDPTMDDNFVIIHAAGMTAYMSRETGQVSYV